jgi:hypothetical protein
MASTFLLTFASPEGRGGESSLSQNVGYEPATFVLQDRARGAFKAYANRERCVWMAGAKKVRSDGNARRKPIACCMLAPEGFSPTYRHRSVMKTQPDDDLPLRLTTTR